MLKRLLLAFVLCLPCAFLYGQGYTVSSPDGSIKLFVNTDKQLSYSVEKNNKVVLASSSIGMKLSDGRSLGTQPKVQKVSKQTINQSIQTPFYRKDQVQDHCNELKILFKGNYGVIFRAYNDGVAYRMVTSFKEDILVTDETVEFNFPKDYQAWVPYVKSRPNNKFQHAFQNTYRYEPIKSFEADKMAFLPLLVDLEDGLKACITESDLQDYPGLYLHNPQQSTGYTALFPPYPKTEQEVAPRQQRVISQSENYIASTKGNRAFPWRTIILSTEDRQLADNDMVYRLGEASRIPDLSWIKPGKSAWDWWSNWSLSGVDFKAGINNETYRYFIDFAADNGLEYIVIDEGWSKPSEGNIMKMIPEIDLRGLAAYAAQKKVGIFIWAVWNVLDDQLEEACKTYSEMGIKGFKIDFFDRDDQKTVNAVYRIASVCADHQLMLDLHGMYKPTGLNRTFPNIVNFEGVFGMEELKWSNPDMPGYDVTFPYIRMLAGTCDYTAGAMKNASKKNFAIVYNEPMSQGTRCHQLAIYVVFDSYFTMLSDSPSGYKKESEYTKLLASLPVVWNETRVLDGKVGEFIVTARRSGNDWFVGGLTNWDARTINVDLSFLTGEGYRAEIYQDGINANEVAVDYKKIDGRVVGSKDRLTINMASGGGFMVRLRK